MSRRTSIRDAEILGQVEGKQSKDLVCGLPINCAKNLASVQCFGVIKCMSRSAFGNLWVLQSSCIEGPLQEKEGRLDSRRGSPKEVQKPGEALYYSRR